VGRFELADGGTIFLDEIGELPAETQVALLRVLQEREFQRVGGNETIRVDVRVVAATNRNVKAAIADGSFRSDLFYRLNVFPIELPPLRERNQDIPDLVAHFLRLYAAGTGKPVRSVDAKMLETLQSYTWPGNVRELQNVVERWAIVSASSDVPVSQTWFAREVLQGTATNHEQAPDGTVNFREYLATVERNLIGRAMTAARGNQSEAARRLGLSRGSLLERLRKYGSLVEVGGAMEYRPQGGREGCPRTRLVCR
jgi:transcriptional regulator with PAS, ATPase and Fis domain